VPAYLDSIYEALGDPFTPDYILMNHSVFKYYTPFARKQDVERTINILRSSEGKRSANMIGINKNTIVSGIDLLFCPTCAINEMLRYGEAYFHVSHNLHGIKVCSKCDGILMPYDIKDKGKREYVSLDTELICRTKNELAHYYKHLKLAKLSKEVITMDPVKLNYDDIIARYKILLLKKGLVYSANRVMQKEIINAFCDYYDGDFLKSINCEITKNESCWVHRFTYSDILHPLKPIEHLLVIGLFCNSIKDFIDIDTTLNYIYPKLRAPEQIGKNEVKIDDYKCNLSKALASHPEWTRSIILKNMPKEYNYVYKHDRKWMIEHLPSLIKTKPSQRIPYEQLDYLYLEKLKQEYARILSLRPPKRVTYERLNAALGKHHISSIQNYPQMQAFMMESVESAEEFRIRKCKLIIDNYFTAGITPKLSRIRLEAGISNYQRMNSIINTLNDYISSRSLN
jgi:hypothetical protein